MTKYWISWWHDTNYRPFLLNFPWWSTGTAHDDAESICAAVIADDEVEARNIITNAYPEKYKIRFRFNEAKPQNWSPFSDRFKKMEWMKWD